MMSPDQRILDDVAARYGCVVAKDARVYRAARGESGFSLPVWDEKTNQLRYPDGAERRAAARDSFYRQARLAAAKIKPEVVQRRAEVVRLHAEGLWIAEIARRLDANAETIRADHQALDLVPAPPPPSKPPVRQHIVPPQVLARNARIAELAAQGMVATEIGAAVGLDGPTIRKIARRLGIEVAVARLGRRAVPQPDVAPSEAKAALLARRDEVARLVAEGLPVVEIARRIGVDGRVVSNDCKRLGLQPVRGTDMRPAIAARIASQNALRAGRIDRVRELAAQGMSVGEMAAAVGVCVHSIRRDLRLLGLPLPERKEPKHGRQSPEERAAYLAREAEVARLLEQGLSRRQVRAMLGVSRNQMTRHVEHLGLVERFPQRVGRDRGVVSPRVQARRERVSQMRADGATIPEMVAALKVSLATICKDIQALGLSNTLPKARKVKLRILDATEIAAVQEALAAGLSIVTVSRRLGVSPERMKSILRREAA